MSKAQRVNEGRLSLFFTALEQELVSYAGNTTPAVDFAIERQFERCRKKARYARYELVIEAEEKFLRVNADVAHCDPSRLPPDVISNARRFIVHVLEGLTKALVPESVQECMDYGVLLDRWRFGPGASNGPKGSHPAQKIDQEWTVTSNCESLAMLLRRLDPHFACSDAGKDRVCHVVRGSIFETVPKNQEAVRPIAKEPIANMCLQLAAGQYISDALKRVGLSIEKQQPKNRLLARLGSIGGHMATIDLSDASNWISIALCRTLLPRRWFQLLMEIRSPEILLLGEWHKCNMISTMGNGFTFALMTLLISSLIYGMRAARDRNPRKSERIFLDWEYTAVYGDDIIVPTYEYEELCSILEKAGFVVNHQKSYSDGPFRESCGGDYLEGYDVTPFYVKNLSTDADIFIAMNQLLQWGAKHDLAMFRSCEVLAKMLRGKMHLVPEWSQPYSGVLTSECPRKYTYLKYVPFKRWYDGMYTVKLAAGGYVSAEPDGTPFFTPRPYKTRYRVSTKRLPNGFLDGWDANYRTRLVSNQVAFLVRCMGTRKPR